MGVMFLMGCDGAVVSSSSVCRRRSRWMDGWWFAVDDGGVVWKEDVNWRSEIFLTFVFMSCRLCDTLLV